MSGRQNYRIFCDDLPCERPGISRDDSLQGIDDYLAEALLAKGFRIDGLDIGYRRELVADVACGHTMFDAAVDIAAETLEGK